MRRRLAVFAASAIAAAALAVPASAASAASAPQPTCSLSGAAFANPFATGLRDAVTSLQTYQNRTWAGFAYDGNGDFSVISWHAGQKAKVLDTFRYRDVTVAPFGRTTVNTVGVTPSGAVVAAVQKLGSTTPSQYQSLFAWVKGHRYRLSAPSTWFSVGAVAVTDNGTIIGYGAYGSRSQPRYHLVSWASPTAQWKSLAYLPKNAYPPVGEQHGDVAWGLNNGSTKKWVRLASGTVRSLITGTPEQPALPRVGAGHFLFAGNGNVVRWDLAHLPTSGSIVGRVVVTKGSARLPQAAGPTGAVVWGEEHRYLKLDGHSSVAIPGEYTADGPVNEVITAQNGVAFTAKDGLVHFFRCH